MHRFATSLLAATALAVAASASALANDVPLHQHHLTTPGGNEVEFARGICKNELQTPMNNLHRQVHLGSPGDAWAENGFSLRIVFC